MVILQGGVPKSGNVWLYKILESIMKHAGLERKSYIQNHPIHPEALTWELSHADQANVDALHIGRRGYSCWISPHLFLERIEDIDDYVRQCSHVWTNSPISSRSFELFPKFDKIVYIIRDPRDAAISRSRWVFTPHIAAHHPPHYERSPDSFLDHTLDEMLRAWVRSVGGYVKHRERFGIYIVFYERLLQEFDSELLKLLAYLGTSLSEEDRRQIREEVSFESMKQESPDHVREGKSSSWMHQLTESQKIRAARIAGKMLGLLNYPVTDGGDPCLPDLPSSLNSSEIDDAVACSRRTVGDAIRRAMVFLTSSRSIRIQWDRVRNWAP